MSDDRQTPAGQALHPLGLGTRAFAYFVVCAVSLAMLLMIQVRQGQGLAVSLLLILVGGGGLLSRFRLAPLLMVVLVTMIEVLRRYFDPDLRSQGDNQQGPAFRTPDILRAVAVLGYVVGHYRLQGIHRHIFPPDYRLAAVDKERSQVARRRSAEAMAALEEPLLILSLPVFALVGQLAWIGVAQPRNLLDWDPWVVRLAMLIITMVLSVSITASLLTAWRRRRMTLAEARLLMQDALWSETRAEQRWFTRWLAWFWIKERDRKEQP
jgi:hypothetical protein